MGEYTAKMDRNIALEAVRVTEAAALAASKLMGRGDEKAADQAAVDAMRTALNSMHMQGTVRIGEGERDEATMLYIGEEVGSGSGPKIDIYIAEFKNGVLTGKQKRINPLEGIETEKIKIIDKKQKGIKKSTKINKNKK